MRRIMTMVMAAFLMSAVVPAFSAAIDHQEEYSCKVEARKCASDLDVAQAKITKMNESIESGATYSEKDMKNLQLKINELNELIDKLKATPKQ